MNPDVRTKSEAIFCQHLNKAKLFQFCLSSLSSASEMKAASRHPATTALATVRQIAPTSAAQLRALALKDSEFVVFVNFRIIVETAKP